MTETRTWVEFTSECDYCPAPAKWTVHDDGALEAMQVCDRHKTTAFS